MRKPEAEVGELWAAGTPIVYVVTVEEARAVAVCRAAADAIDAAVEVGFAGESYVTGVLAELQLGTGRLSWVNAGHPEPLLLRGGQHVKTLGQGSGLPFGLGLPDRVPYPLGEEQLEPGALVREVVASAPAVTCCIFATSCGGLQAHSAKTKATDKST